MIIVEVSAEMAIALEAFCRRNHVLDPSAGGPRQIKIVFH